MYYIINMAYRVLLTKKEMIAEQTMAFYFKKPEGFTYQAGQYGDFALIDPAETDDEGAKRTFSLASAPFEPYLMIATRMRDTAFKRTLKKLPEGSELAFEGPFGSLALPRTTSRTAVFLTGGIGVTLVRSMVVQATQERLPQKMILFCANYSRQDTVFFEEFTRLAARNEYFTFVPTMTGAGTQNQKWLGESGLITLDMVRKYVNDMSNAVFYLSGPGEMVGAMRRLLIAAGVSRTGIRSDLFVGY